jgi:ketosteroid isomerase-like protein
VSQADIDTLRAGYEAVRRGDWDSILGTADPDFELKTADRFTNPGTYRGVETARQFFDDFLGPFEEVVPIPQKFFEDDDRIAVLLLVKVRPRGSSAVLENRIGHVWTFRDGRALRLEIYPEREKALEAIGMSESEARAEAA